jgi:transposase
MSNKIFTEAEIEILSKNQYVTNISAKGITYTDEFKRIFIAENESGKLPRDIFIAYGFDIDILGMDRVRSSGNRWRAAYRNDGICGLQDTRKQNTGRTNEEELSLEEKYKRLKAENNLLQAENELLKKIDMLERGLLKKK